MKTQSANAEVASEQPTYSIRVVSRLTGLSADTLRMWERRYGFPEAERANSGVRLYARGDIERLTLVARALKLGYRVSEAISLDVRSLQNRLAHSTHVR